MAEEITSSVKTTSDGVVKITVERYQELLDKAAEKAPIIYRTVQKTPEILASENKGWGITFMGFGAALLIFGAVQFATGVKQAKNLTT